MPLMDVGFAAIGQLARTLPASHPVLVHRLASLLHASFRPHLTVRPLRFAITSPPSGCEEDLHLQAVDHARHTNKKARCHCAGPVIYRLVSPRQVFAASVSAARCAARIGSVEDRFDRADSETGDRAKELRCVTPKIRRSKPHACPATASRVHRPVASDETTVREPPTGRR